jgi:uncharacterized protein (DUF1684 family)
LAAPLDARGLEVSVSRWFRSIGLGFALVMTAARATAGDAAAPQTHADEIRAWHDKRVKNLTSDTGWLTVAGLYWLQEGGNSFGTSPKNAIVLPPGSGPELAGVIELAGKNVTVHGNPGVVLRVGDATITTRALQSDASGTPDVVEMGRLRFFVIVRGGRYAIRLRDLEAPTRKQFTGIESYDVDDAWRVEARFEPYSPPRHIPIASIIGTIDSMTSPGALVFSHDGKEFRLDPVLESADAGELFVIFKDETSGVETYGGGRFLYASMPKDGKTVLDFNKAYNPPCAFTEYATCPLPPLQNELPIAVHAGEKKYGHH